jgi:hypothetical protein
LLREAAPLGIRVQCTIPFWIPPDDPRKEEMTCSGPDGAPMQSIRTLFRPDINNEAWRGYVLGEVEDLVDAGCTSFQQDSAWLNAQENLKPKGCFSDASIRKFRAYLRSTFSPAQLQGQFGIADVDAFDYRAEAREALGASFAAFQKQATSEYHRWLHDAVEAYARRKDPAADIVFSGNIVSRRLEDGRSDWLVPHFDFFLSETRGDRETMPGVLRGLAQEASKFPGVSGITLVSRSVWLNQRAMASAYALGLTAIMPWDVYIAPDKPRFFADPADFSKLTGLIRANQPLFDDYVLERDDYGTYGPAWPSQGRVTQVDRTTYPGRTAVRWSRGRDFKKLRRGQTVRIGGTTYETVVDTGVGLLFLPAGAKVAVGDPVFLSKGQGTYLVTVRQHVGDPQRKAVHTVSWNEKTLLLYLHLKREDFPEPPTMLVTPNHPEPTPVEPQVSGDYYVYRLGGETWSVLF